MGQPVRVVGTGVGRTGTMSLKVALEQLLGTPCYHMVEVFGHPEHMQIWTQAARDEPVDWAALLDDYGAIVDWPGASFWPELTSAFPDALVLHSERADAETWWRSASATILAFDAVPPELEEFREMVLKVFRERFTDRIDDHDACVAAYEAHNARVRAAIDPERMLVWHPGDGWEPICRALDVPVPDAPFPHTNTTEEWQERRAAQRAEDA
jgi:hypothetical protein